jgi:hypothetical protein
MAGLSKRLDTRRCWGLSRHLERVGRSATRDDHRSTSRNGCGSHFRKNRNIEATAGR